MWCTSRAVSYTHLDVYKRQVEYLFEYADTLFNNLLFDENIERIMHTPFSSKTPAYLNALHTSFSSYRLMNPDLAEIALVTPEMSWSSYFDAVSYTHLDVYKRQGTGSSPSNIYNHAKAGQI